jgi:hypothetical protein
LIVPSSGRPEGAVVFFLTGPEAPDDVGKISSNPRTETLSNKLLSKFYFYALNYEWILREQVLDCYNNAENIYVELKLLFYYFYRFGNATFVNGSA